VATLAPQCCKGLDEAGVNLAMPRLYGRAPRGERVIGAGPQTYGTTVPMLAALGSQGVAAVRPLDGATEAEGFRLDGEPVRRPTRRQGDLVRMDNRRAPKSSWQR
jgi:hypothetical protein